MLLHIYKRLTQDLRHGGRLYNDPLTQSLYYWMAMAGHLYKTPGPVAFQPARDYNCRVSSCLLHFLLKWTLWPHNLWPWIHFKLNRTLLWLS
ncbi:hypothetical protein CY34DRAFT_126724 [Suillus luteus UH-Slu-Lm8-n1]|uniref:Uncharacterized protein n=1 Tax=Suillus luteus UH-Slu-Lm8-n1 TaxID=930992 RepID=A0A0D0B229_9AGAM|nr:hypothetical protein CY34DRAFT_126724 [Suillus luteus UH-Slu-Lm8-n1]